MVRRRAANASNPVSDSARDAVLNAARVEFAAKGLDGGRINEIAHRAGVNKQLIYYYFGSKEELYRAALEAVYLEIRRMEAELRLGDLPPLKAMEALIGFSFDYLAAHPEFIRLLNHENAQGATHVHGSEVIRATSSPLIDLITTTLRQGAQAGAFRSDVDPVNFYISVAGMSYFFFSNQLTLSTLFGRDLASARHLRAYRRHVIAAGLEILTP